MNEALPFLILGLAMVPVFGFLTARDSGKFGRPRWPARYPPSPRDIYGDVRRRLGAALLTDDERWTEQCARTWEPGDDGEQVRT